MINIVNGVVKNTRVKTQIFSKLEHGEMTNVNGVILHQTSSDFTIKTLLEYALRPSGIGAHFLIDQSGQIIQTARINQICWHVGRIRSYCQELHRCSPSDQEVFRALQSKYGGNQDELNRQINAFEQKKLAADRYPTNDDSIGIEVVGAPLNGSYKSPNPQQNNSSQWLVKVLVETLKLDRSRIFPHGLVNPYKMRSEGTQVKY